MPRGMSRTDVLLVSLGSTAGLRAADAELAAALERAGAERRGRRRAGAARGAHVRAHRPRLGAGRARAPRGAGSRRTHPRAIVYSTTTAALLWPRPGAIRYDALAAANRPGRHGVWQRPLERRRLREAPLLLPWAAGSLRETPAPHAPARRRPGARRAVGPGGARGATSPR